MSNLLKVYGDFAFTGSNNLKLGGAVTLYQNSLITVSNGTLTLSGDISSGGLFNITKTGSGTLILSGSNDYTGNTNINGGTIEVTGSGALGSGDISMSNGTSGSPSTLNFNGGEPSIPTVVEQDITVSGYGQLQNSGGNTVVLGATGGGNTINKTGSTLIFSGGTFTVNSLITGTSSGGAFDSDVWVNGGADVTLTTQNTYFGATYVFGGATLRNGINNALPTSTSLILGYPSDNSLGTYDLHGYNQTVAQLKTAGTNQANSLVLNTGSTASTLTVSGSTGGPTDASTYAGKIQGNVSLVVDGGAKLTLSGTNTYTGSTTVQNASTLWIAGTHTGGGAFSVISSSTLGLANGASVAVSGTGLTVDSTSTLKVGDSIADSNGHATVDGNVDISNATLSIMAGGSTVADYLVVTDGTLNLTDSKLVLNLYGNLVSSSSPYYLVDITGVTGGKSGVNGWFTGLTYTSYDGGTYTSPYTLSSVQYYTDSGSGHTYIALVPEPSTWVMLLTAGMMGAVGYWRRRRQNARGLASR